MEKVDLNNMLDLKKSKNSSISKIFDKIMNTPLCREFIDKYELTNKDIMDNSLAFLLVSENYEKCKNCQGFEHCPLEGVKGYFNIPVIDFSTIPVFEKSS